MNAVYSTQKKKAGRPLGSGAFAYIDSSGKKVYWATLLADAKRGIEYFWSKRGGRS